MGRPAKTPEEHWLAGTRDQSKTSATSVYAGGRPRIPSHLSPVARAEFKRACKVLLDRGTSTEGDFVTLAIYSETYARWRDAKEQVIGKLMVETIIKDANGVAKVVTRLNPLIKVVQADESRLLALASKLGLTPSDRDRVRPTKTKRDLEVIRGSMADVMPDMLNDESTPATPILMPPPSIFEEDEVEPEERDEHEA
jgi:P27 family predicted phage terminase small subunit